MSTDLAFEYAARAFAPTPRRWPTPGALACELDRATVQTPALDLVDRQLVDLADGRTERLMVFLPPQEGKSTKASYWYPLWLLAHDPTLRIGIVSYSYDKATRWGRRIRRAIDSHPQLGIRLKRDSRAVDRLETEQGGGVVCVGIGGGLTGEPVDVLLLDDVVRGRAEAESATYRDGAWDWWESVGSTRLSARGRVCVIMTRWHADDLAGRLLANEPGEWRVLRLPAIVNDSVRGDDGAAAYDPSGELISVQRRAPGYFHALKAKRSAYVWRSLFDGDPVAAEGNLFRRPDFRYWHRMPADPSLHGRAGGRRVDLGGRALHLEDCWRFLTVDLAASKKTAADWTVAACWAIGPDGDLVLLDRARSRVEEGDHWSLVRPLRERWAADTVYVEESFISTTLAIQATRAGVPVAPVKAEGDKLTRALPATAKVATGRVWFPAAAAWLDEWCDELAAFPSGAHDDQVDTLAYAVRIVEAHWLPAAVLDRPGANRLESEVTATAYAAAVGRSPNGFDNSDVW